MQKDCREQSLPCASRHLHISVQWSLRIEMKSLNSNKVSEIDFFTVCLVPRSFGAGTSRGVLGTFLPASHSLQLCLAVQKRTQNPPERAIIRKPGEKSGLGLTASAKGGPIAPAAETTQASGFCR